MTCSRPSEAARCMAVRPSLFPVSTSTRFRKSSSTSLRKEATSKQGMEIEKSQLRAFHNCVSVENGALPCPACSIFPSAAALMKVVDMCAVRFSNLRVGMEGPKKSTQLRWATRVMRSTLTEFLEMTAHHSIHLNINQHPMPQITHNDSNQDTLDAQTPSSSGTAPYLPACCQHFWSDNFYTTLYDIVRDSSEGSWHHTAHCMYAAGLPVVNSISFNVSSIQGKPHEMSCILQKLILGRTVTL